MKYIAIKDAYNIRKGKKVIVSDCKTETSIRNIQIGDLRNNDLIKYCEPNIKYVLAKKDDILIAWDGANAGTIGFHLEGAIGSTLAKLTPKHNGLFYTPFIGYYLQTKFNYFQNTASGATIPHISKKSLESLKLPIISMEKQKKIVNYIQETKYLINNVNYQIQLLDELEESLFIEMFGDPVKNTKNFNKEKLKYVASKIGSGATPRGGNSTYQISGISLIRSMNVHNNYFSSKGLAYLNDEQAGKLSNVIVKSGDILLNITGASVARTCIINDQFLPARVNQHVAIIRCNNEKINNIFLNRQLTCYYYQLYLIGIATSGGATREAITKKQLENLKIIIPPIDLQNEFAKKIEKIEEIKKQSQKSLKYYEELYETLLYKAFNGELFKE
ncbi:restriction endonuclease subunit S [Staphylococcus xylosus]|uniref:Restriction endonuclease subunit S n=1 Tax=Staphylococcus xylosus TaxID=1288 RepID=A0A5R9B223_STAXY|nr:restriction endonuclease subunit S [Staphylococcus xylosus]MEB7798871.1 restriction endonuclease subunit S [Staphylococcus xylosus]PTH95346.1 restriction endonuclease subunit S [Staphylococcus xylosus]QDW87914.1 restriction endonuclease subunit S [Staphylococcus xylosus]TLP89890.1 restriction endonuclease subunit S [Staphylococcus xylosus]